MAISTRLRTPSLDIKLARWVLTVLRLMYSSSAISAFVRPLATVSSTSSSSSTFEQRPAEQFAQLGKWSDLSADQLTLLVHVYGKLEYRHDTLFKNVVQDVLADDDDQAAQDLHKQL